MKWCHEGQGTMKGVYHEGAAVKGCHEEGAMKEVL